VSRYIYINEVYYGSEGVTNAKHALVLGPRDVSFEESPGQTSGPGPGYRTTEVHNSGSSSPAGSPAVAAAAAAYPSRRTPLRLWLRTGRGRAGRGRSGPESMSALPVRSPLPFPLASLLLVSRVN
jgi:hypothetical protein